MHRLRRGRHPAATTRTDTRQRRSHGAGVATGVLVVAALVGCAAEPGRPGPDPARPASSATSTPTSTTSPPSRERPAAAPPTGDPERVVVETPRGEALVDAPLAPEDLDDAGVLAPPPGVVGWYDEPGWPRPGFPGASILAGHVNTRRSGPDTFARLPEARVGARVTVTYDSGDEVSFLVTRSQAVPKKDTPRDDSIWDAGAPRPLLRLITCDPTTPVKGGHYQGNWVLWASPAPV